MNVQETPLTSQQKEAIEHKDGPLLIVAGAGTGKTLVITHRIAHLISMKVARPEEILAVTFTEKAAAEMAERVDVLLPYGFANVPIMTFHAFGDRILREFGVDLGIDPDFNVLSQPEQVLFFREHLFDFPLDLYRPLSNPTRFIQDMLALISRAKDEDVSPSEYKNYAEELKTRAAKDLSDESLQDEALRQMEIACTYDMYQQILQKAGNADFGDQVALVLRLFRERPSVLSQIRSRYRFILVDEFQDTNYAQFQLVKALGGDEANLTVVGDDDQSIYKFRGAAISNMINFVDTYPNAHQVILTQNFRSTQDILDTAYRLILHNNPDRLEVKNHIDKRLIAQRGEGLPVEHDHFDALTTEADRVAATIAELIENKGYTYSDVAILVRTNSGADPFLRALNLKEIPWRFSGNRGLYTRPEIILLISFLKVITDIEDSMSLYALAASEVYELSMEALNRCVQASRKARRPLIDVFRDSEGFDVLISLNSESQATIQKLVSDVEKFTEVTRDHVTGIVLYRFLTETGYLKRLTQRETVEQGAKVQNIARFFDTIWSFSQVVEEDRTLYFVRYLDLLREAGDDPGTVEADPDTEAVNVMTVHKAKGLEWPVVFLVSLVDKRFPHVGRSERLPLPDVLVKDQLPGGDFHLQEERRLFYVAMTRAKERLYLTSARDYGGSRSKKVSPFVLEAMDRTKADEIVVKARAEERIHRFAPSPGTEMSVMAPIPENQTLTVSHYQVDDFLTCPLKYKYVHILRVPILPHHSVVYGKAIHTALELYHRHRVNQMPVSLEDVQQAYEKAWQNIGFISREHEERRFQAGLEALKGFFLSQEASDQNPQLVEEPFSFMMGTNRLVGRWDRVDLTDDGPVIIDFKSSEIYQQEKANERARKSLQLAIYGIAYNETFDVPVAYVELHFLTSGLVGRAKLTEKRIEGTKKKVEEAVCGIRQRTYAAKPSKFTCAYCAYADICPSAIRG